MRRCGRDLRSVSRPAMRFVVIRTVAQQATAGIHKVRDLLLKQRTMITTFAV